MCGKRLLGLGVVIGLLILPSAANARSCDPIVNPYEGTRYEGVDLTDIEAKNVSCSNAQRFVEKAHRKALGVAPSADGYRFFRYDGFSVQGNLRPSSDRYRATRNDKLIRWRF